MNKQIWILIILAIIIIGLIGALIIFPQKSAKAPEIKTGLVVLLPKPNEEISSPIKITGYVNGDGWAGFEGQVGNVKLLDYKGNVLGQTFLAATSNWMSSPVNFETNLTFISSNPGPATLVFHNENPSGDPARDKTFTLPVKLAASSETMTVKAFFAKKDEPVGSTCAVVFPVERIVPKTTAVAKAALTELLKGPTDTEKTAGYYSNINSGVKIQSLTIDANGTARADFSSELESTGGSCRVTEIRSEINFTLKQFSTIKSVVISINGRTEDILQP